MLKAYPSKRAWVVEWSDTMNGAPLKVSSIVWSHINVHTFSTASTPTCSHVPSPRTRPHYTLYQIYVPAVTWIWYRQAHQDGGLKPLDQPGFVQGAWTDLGRSCVWMALSARGHLVKEGWCEYQFEVVVRLVELCDVQCVSSHGDIELT